MCHHRIQFFSVSTLEARMPSLQSLMLVRVWDLPTRIFHWLLAICFSGLLITGNVGGSAMSFHFRFGYALLALLLFRLIWGVLGGHWSRFSSFLFSPKVTLAFIKGQSSPAASTGHSPLGALSVWALLGFLSGQVATGLISDDEILFAGPLTHLVSNATVSMATSYHVNIGKWILSALVLLHLAAVAYYTFRKHRLISAMIHGDKLVATASQPSRDDLAARLLALFIFGLCAAAAYGVSTLRASFF
jgi:cytochrome b